MSLISYQYAWHGLFLSQCDIDSLEKIQRTPTRMIFPDDDYDVRLSLLQLPVLSEFMFHLFFHSSEIPGLIILNMLQFYNGVTLIQYDI